VLVILFICACWRHEQVLVTRVVVVGIRVKGENVNREVGIT
jgi:hypothetical protein